MESTPVPELSVPAEKTTKDPPTFQLDIPNNNNDDKMNRYMSIVNKPNQISKKIMGFAFSMLDNKNRTHCWFKESKVVSSGLSRYWTFRRLTCMVLYTSISNNQFVFLSCQTL